MQQQTFSQKPPPCFFQGFLLKVGPCFSSVCAFPVPGTHLAVFHSCFVSHCLCFFVPYIGILGGLSNLFSSNLLVFLHHELCLFGYCCLTAVSTAPLFHHPALTCPPILSFVRAFILKMCSHLCLLTS